MGFLWSAAACRRFSCGRGEWLRVTRFFFTRENRGTWLGLGWKKSGSKLPHSKIRRTRRGERRAWSLGRSRARRRIRRRCRAKHWHVYSAAPQGCLAYGRGDLRPRRRGRRALAARPFAVERQYL